jgi:ketosteroid isomerase-like protein
LSRENVEIVRRAYAAWALGNFVPEVYWAESLEWYASADDPDTAATRGRTAVCTVLEEWLGHLGRYDLDYECIDAGDEVLVCLRFLLEGAHTPLLSYHACSVADGKIGRVRAHAHRDQALKAVGLEK